MVICQIYVAFIFFRKRPLLVILTDVPNRCAHDGLQPSGDALESYPRKLTQSFVATASGVVADHGLAPFCAAACIQRRYL
jgi:hypothetical protein